ncbi:MAG: FAD-binding oxidoreductase [Thermoanaerobaculia bacterium]|nr:FAD-binding oxidoreductase [Thermoanaerobaculia bacterium]
MTNNTLTIANWGNYPKTRAELIAPGRVEELRNLVSARDRLIARGNGKCYGDAALGPCIISSLHLNRILDFDAEKGIVRCEAGVLLADLLDVIVPAGWFFHVTPGIKNITVGGAVACDVHGKNHPAKGCFSNWLISFELMRADGGILTCSRSQHADLFWQTCGGMGWTGIILSASFQLMPLHSIYMRQLAVRAENFEELFAAFDKHKNLPYAAAWVDCLSDEPAPGRGVVYFADHAAPEHAETQLVYPKKKTRNVPFYAPSWLLNKWSIRAHNAMLFSRSRSGEQLADLDRYFYPLDSIRNWNRLYGRRGFIQYQFCLPEKHSFEGIRHILQTIRRSPDIPFLTVLKRHGDRPAEAVHSFPIRGYSLALDFPRTRGIFSLVRVLDELVWHESPNTFTK